MKEKNFVWVVTAKSESGDEYGPWIFAHKPTDEELFQVSKERCPGEFEDFSDNEEEPDGPGSWGSYLHVSKPAKVEVIP